MKCVTPSTINGTVQAPASKSMTVRAVAAGLLADGVSQIRYFSPCDDALAAVGIAKTLGAVVQDDGRSLVVHGTGRSRLKPARAALDCRESGLCMRLFAPIAALSERGVVLKASGSLKARPMAMLEDLQRLGVSCQTAEGLAPVRVQGPLRGGRIVTEASLTSQFLSGLLMALPLAEEDSDISVRSLRSSPYVRMTLGLLKDFGIRFSHDEGLERIFIPGRQSYRPHAHAVEGDWSGAAFLLVAGALAGRVCVQGLDADSLQADRAVLQALEQAGASVSVDIHGVTVERKELKPFRFDASSCPDLFAPLAALASACHGTSVISGAERLVHKESDRSKALISEFGKLGVDITVVGTNMAIAGGDVQGGTVDSHQDHRIAMACATAGLIASDKVCIAGWQAVSKSYPDFFTHLEAVKE